MKDLQRRHGLTYVMISHDLAVIRYMADTIGVMYLGKLVELGPSADVYARPAHPYTQGLLDAVPTAAFATSRQQRKLTVRGELPSAVNPPSGCRFRTRCPRAQNLCAEVEPLLVSFGGGHTAACHFPLETPAPEPRSASALPAVP
jgi:oligopeptide/dipeptide ABC transporter ATP-binding protein